MPSILKAPSSITSTTMKKENNQINSEALGSVLPLGVMGGLYTVKGQVFQTKRNQETSYVLWRLWHVEGSQEKPIYLHPSQGFPNSLTTSLFLSVICDPLVKLSRNAILDLFTLSAEVVKKKKLGSTLLRMWHSMIRWPEVGLSRSLILYSTPEFCSLWD